MVVSYRILERIQHFDQIKDRVVLGLSMDLLVFQKEEISSSHLEIKLIGLHLLFQQNKLIYLMKEGDKIKNHKHLFTWIEHLLLTMYN
jgi:hypothetical protein